MGSAKKRTTMGKLNRENAVRERRMRKIARKEARAQAAAAGETAPAPADTGDDLGTEAPAVEGDDTPRFDTAADPTRPTPVDASAP